MSDNDYARMCDYRYEAEKLRKQRDDLVKAAKRCRAALAAAVVYAGGEANEHEAIQQLDAALAKAAG